MLFCSDGTYLDLAEDIVRAGADGLIFEPCNDFTAMVDRFGGSICLVGSHVDCRDLTFGHWDAVARDVDRTFRDLERCRGAIIAVGNHLPANIDDGILERYLDRVTEGERPLKLRQDHRRGTARSVSTGWYPSCRAIVVI